MSRRKQGIESPNQAEIGRHAAESQALQDANDTPRPGADVMQAALENPYSFEGIHLGSDQRPYLVSRYSSARVKEGRSIPGILEGKNRVLVSGENVDDLSWHCQGVAVRKGPDTFVVPVDAFEWMKV